MAEKQEKLTSEWVDYLQGNGFVLLNVSDSEMGDMPIRVLPWVKAMNDTQIRFFVGSNERILRHLQFDQNITLTVFGLGTVLGLLCTACSLNDRIGATDLALIQATVYEVREAMPTDSRLTALPDFDYNDSSDKIKAFNDERFRRLVTFE